MSNGLAKFVHLKTSGYWPRSFFFISRLYFFLFLECMFMELDYLLCIIPQKKTPRM